MTKPFDKTTYTYDWIDSVSKQFVNADKILIEKVIQALTLLSVLNQSGLQFIFKGGTALMLMLNKPSRLSIDIDIVVPDKNVDLESIFNQIIENKIFTKYTQQQRYVVSDIEKAHYKFFYSPVTQTHSIEQYVLLDILFEKNPYNKLIQTAIQSPFVQQSGSTTTVSTPSLEEILGDKLTAFAPNTTGIPYYKGKNSMGMEIVKQLYDIGNLFDAVSDVAAIRKTFETIAKTELKYRDLVKTPDDVLNDIIQTALCISTRGKINTCRFNDLQKGIQRIKSYIYAEKFHIEQAIVSSAKAANLASILKSGKNEIQHFLSTDSITNEPINNPDYNKLNKLKNSQPEAFFYWHKAIETQKW